MYINYHLSVSIGVKILHIIGNDLLVSDEYQFLVIQKGTIIVQYQDTDEKIMLQKDDLLLVSPNRAIICIPYTENTVLGIRLDTPFIAGIIPAGHYLSCDSTQGSRLQYNQLHQILTRICSTFYMENNQLLMAALANELTDCLKKNFIQQVQTFEMSDLEQRNQLRIGSITQYLRDYYHQPISLDMLADKMFLTPQYLSKFIKKHLGTTFSRFLTTIRLEHAHTELISTDNSITNIALDNGFPNIAAFNKAFRDTYDNSPSTYRSQIKRNHSSKILEGKPYFEDSEHELAPSIMEITTSIDTVVPYHKPWADTINIGFLQDAMKISFHDGFLEYQKAIPVKYVRFHDIFSEEILYLDPNTDEFNFTNLDEVMDFFYHANVIPFVELGYKPRNHFLSDKTPWTENKMVETEKNSAYYCRALAAFLKHSINHLGMHYMSQWRFEFWLKHSDKLKYDTSFEDYFKQYKAFSKIIKELLPSCAFGGPGFNMCSNINGFSIFLKQAAQQNISFDFISLYGYGHEAQTIETPELLDNNGILSTNPNHIYETFCKYKEILAHTRYSKLPVYLTEMTSSLALENYIKDSLFEAAFLCKNMLQFLPSGTNVAYLSLWDICTELRQTRNNYSPSAGLIGENGIPTPALHAYSLLTRLGKNLISQGDNYIMTCNSSNRYQLLFYHYSHYHDSFCLNPWEQIPLEHTYELFGEVEAMPILFTCKQFPPGRYKVVMYSLNRNYGSALDKYLRILDISSTTSGELLEILLNLREEEARYYKRTSIPRQDIYFITCGDTLTLNLTLDCHEVVFYEISRVF